ncbi:MAG: flagellar basal-body MS-ring/collar protein FliF [Spirochaetota bacterium]|nr:flagellar basal-body MS-ring/collar protein FliF [Spirochaetota bacterium]
MNEFFQKLITQIKSLWGKLSLIQKIILFAVLAVAILGIVLLVNFSASPSMVPLITAPVTDQEQLSRISRRLDEEGVSHSITETGQVYVKDKQTAQRMVAILMREDLIPKETSPWDVFKMDRWSVTDFERNVNLRQAITTSIEQHIESLDEVDSAQVTLVIPEQTLFEEDQNPVTASVIITPTPGSDFAENRKKIEGIEKLVIFGVEGLQKENLVISDHNGIVLNDFADLAEFDRLELSKRQMEQKAQLENKYKAQIFKELSQIFGAKRVSVLKVDIDLDFRKETVQTEEHFPVTTVPDNPNTPYSEREYVLSIPRSKEIVNEEFKGTGFNPEGPPGQEGQTPPAYKDLDNLVGEYKNSSQIVNEEVNTRNVYEEKSPWEIKRITIGVALDGIWEKKYNKNGTVKIDEEGHIVREYTAVSEDSLQKAQDLVEHAIGYNRERGDSVTVQHIQFDRSSEFQQEDEKFRSRKRMQQIVLYSALGICVIMIAFIVFRLISRELERRRRLREEELARQHQMAREAVLRSAEEEEEGMEVGMSVEERARMEMQENAINMAREHPEDVAQLIRTWLAEE